MMNKLLARDLINGSNYAEAPGPALRDKLLRGD